GHADTIVVGAQDMADQARGGGLAVGAGHGDHRNAAVVAILEHRRDDRFADRAALAERGFDVHAQTRCSIDLDHATALFFQCLEHGFTDDIDAADVESDHLRRFDRTRCQFRMYVVGDVGGGAAGREVGIVAQQYRYAARGNAVDRVALFFEGGDADAVETDLGQRRGMAVAAQWIEIDQRHQFANGVFAI